MCLDGAPSSKAAALGNPVNESFFLNGRVLSTDLPLAAARAGSSRQIDTQIEVDRSAVGRNIPRSVPEGMLLAEHRRGDFGHCVTRKENNYLLRLFGMCDFLIDHKLDRVEVRPAAELPEDLLATLCSGILSSLLAILSKNWPLHASAVRWTNGLGVAFLGGSGAGKTTLAAACCTVGGQLVTDDVLVTDTDSSGQLTCFSGATELRLRENSLELAIIPTSWARRITADHRTAAQPKPSADFKTPLHALVLPKRTSAKSIKITRLSTAEAVLELARYPRFAGWTEPQVLETRFRRLSAIARTASLWRMEMPFGSPASAIEKLLLQIF